MRNGGGTYTGVTRLNQVSVASAVRIGGGRIIGQVTFRTANIPPNSQGRAQGIIIIVFRELITTNTTLCSL
jgi:hypothetical protein